jgi:hypothetical protein
VVTVADSFYLTMFGNGVSAGLFGRHQYWYYYRQAYEGKGGPRNVADLDRKAELEGCDLVLLLSTEANLSGFPFGFIEDAYRLYYPAAREGAIDLLRGMMDRDATWKRDLERRAAATGESLESVKEKELQDALRDDTPAVLDEAQIKSMTEAIRGDPNWLDVEGKRAAARGLGLEDMLRKEVIWIIRNRNKPFVQKYWPLSW